RVPEQLNVRRFSGLKINAHNVKAKWRITLDFAQKFTRHLGEITLLFRVNRGFCRENGARGAGLDFDKAQRLAVPSHKVKLTAAARAAVIARDDHVTLLAQIEVSCFLAAASGIEVLRSGILARQEAHERVKGAEGEAGELSCHWFISTPRSVASF